MAVKADELVRKPFQPQELVARVKNLLHPRSSSATFQEGASGDSAATPRPASQVFASLFSPPPSQAPASGAHAARLAAPTSTAPRAAAQHAGASTTEIAKLRSDVVRLELLVQKLQASLEAEKKYCEALEAHLKTLQES
jgi:DNA-binding response OmpR family regulator